MIIRANTTSVHTIHFYDENSTPVQPSSGTYTVTDLNSGTVVVTPTTFTPVTPWESITLTPSQNAMLNTADLMERRELGITFTYSGTKMGAATEVLTLNAGNVTVEDVKDNLLGWVLDSEVDSEIEIASDDIIPGLPGTRAQLLLKVLPPDLAIVKIT